MLEAKFEVKFVFYSNIFHKTTRKSMVLVVTCFFSVSNIYIPILVHISALLVYSKMSTTWHTAVKKRSKNEKNVCAKEGSRSR